MANSKRKDAATVTTENHDATPFTDVQVIEGDQHAQEVQKTIKTEIVKFNIADAKIAEIKKQFGGLKIKKLDDKVAYEKVTAALAIVRPLRTGIENKRKELKSDYLKVGRAIDDEAERLTKLLLEVETPLKAEKEKVDKFKEAEKIRIENEAQAKLDQRVNDLKAAGIVFDGSFYSVGPISVDIITIKTMEDDRFNTLIDAVKEAAEKIRLEKEAKEKEERDAREKFEADQLKLKQEQEAQQKERAQIMNERRELRTDKIKALGFEFQAGRNVWEISISGQKSSVNLGDLGEMSSEIFNSYFDAMKDTAADLTAKAEQFKKDQHEAQEKANRGVLRQQYLGTLGMYADGPELFSWKGRFEPTRVNVTRKDISDADQSEWDKIFKTAADSIAEINKRDEAEDSRLAEINRIKGERILKLQEIGIREFVNGTLTRYVRPSRFCEKYSDVICPPSVLTASDSDWDFEFSQLDNDVKNLIIAEANEEARIKEEAEKKRQAQMSDVDKAKEYFCYLSQVSRPVVSDPTCKKLIEEIEEKINISQGYIQQLQNKI